MATINLGQVVGADGVGIKSIVKTSTVGLIDTYTVTMTNNATSTFTVTNGAKGDTGEQGVKGDKGDTGTQGVKGDKGDTGEQGIKGDKGDTGANGANGTNGTDGEDGVGIVSIEETATAGLVDTYTITLTNGNKEYFTVTNGRDGSGAEGAVLYTEQTLTDAQKTQARANIGAGTATGGGTAKTTTYDNTQSGLTAINVQEALDEVFQSASDGKALLATVITNKGVDTYPTDTYAQIAENIGNLPLTYSDNSYTYVESTTEDFNMGILNNVQGLDNALVLVDNTIEGSRKVEVTLPQRVDSLVTWDGEGSIEATYMHLSHFNSKNDFNDIIGTTTIDELGIIPETFVNESSTVGIIETDVLNFDTPAIGEKCVFNCKYDDKNSGSSMGYMQVRLIDVNNNTIFLQVGDTYANERRTNFQVYYNATRILNSPVYLNQTDVTISFVFNETSIVLSSTKGGVSYTHTIDLNLMPFNTSDFTLKFRWWKYLSNPLAYMAFESYGIEKEISLIRNEPLPLVVSNNFTLIETLQPNQSISNVKIKAILAPTITEVHPTQSESALKLIELGVQPAPTEAERLQQLETLGVI